MFGANVLVAQALGLFSGIRKDALALIGQREIDGGGNLFPDGGVLLNLLANGLDGCMGAEEAVGKRFVLA